MKLTPLKKVINLEGKTAIVTGGAMGIGFGIAYRLAEAGVKIVIADLNEEAGNKASKELSDDGFKVAFIKTDVSNEENRWCRPDRGQEGYPGKQRRHGAHYPCYANDVRQNLLSFLRSLR